jgi:hypothetical protein
MLKRLIVLTFALQFLLLPANSQPAIAGTLLHDDTPGVRNTGFITTMSPPVEVDFDKAITVMHTSAPVDKQAFAYVSTLVLKDVKDSLSISGSNANCPPGTWQIVYPLHMGYFYSDGSRYEGTGRKPSVSGSGRNPMWMVPLSTNEIKTYLQLLKRLGPNSCMTSDMVTVAFRRYVPGKPLHAVTIYFRREGFFHAYYSTQIEKPVPPGWHQSTR